MLRSLAILILAFAPFFLSAQDKNVIIRGKVVDQHSGAALESAHIKVHPTNKGVVTDSEGRFQIQLRLRKKNIEVSTSFVGYNTSVKYLHLIDHTDTLNMVIKLAQAPTPIKPVQILAESRPDTVYGSFSYCVADFEFYQDKLLLLTYASRAQKNCSLLLQGKNGEIMLSVGIPGNATSLHKDFQDEYYVLCDENVFKINIESSMLLPVPMSKEYFEANVEPGIDMIGEKIIFSDYKWNQPEFTYYTVWQNDTVVNKLKTITNQSLKRMYRFEYYYLDNESRVKAWKLADAYEGLDKFEAAALMTGFQNTLYYDPLYAPMFVIDDTVLIFDHYSNKLYKYDKGTREVDSVEIAYHRNKAGMKWRKKLVKDNTSGEIYALFQKNGHYYLNAVDTDNGSIMGSFKMSDKYTEKMKIKDDYVYYVYDPQDKYQTPYLYREQIRL